MTAASAIDPGAPLRRTLAEQLESAGIVGAAADAILAETAPRRHAWRVERATEALIDAAVAARPLPDDICCPLDIAGQPCSCSWAPEDGVRHYRQTLDIRMVAAMIGYADAMGVGGRMGVSGAATARVPGLMGLGKMRKHARDGAAWSAAIRAACDALNPVVERTRESRILVGMMAEPEMVTYTVREPAWRFAVDASDLATMYFGAVEPAISADGEVNWVGDVVPVDDVIPHAWRFTIAREGLRRAAGLEPWHPSAPFYAPPESLSQWAAAVNALEAGD